MESAQSAPPASESARRKKLGEIAVERGLVTPAQVSDALSAQDELQKLGLSERLGTILLKKKAISKDTLTELLREQSGGVKRLGNFEIMEKVGQGAMGVVYKARQISMDRVVALKILARKYATDPQFIERFVKEARAAGQFSHENIVTALDVGFFEPYHYFAMEYVEGKTLRKVLAENGALPEADAVKYTLHIAKALEHALTKNIIHRDVKPENVIVTPHGIAKLLDMGLACAAGADAEEDETKEKQPKKAVGTPHYISPEAARGQEDLDTRADLYSLGCSFYQLLTNATPFEGNDARGIMARHLAEDVPDPRAKRPEIGVGAARIVEKLCARNRDERYPHPTALIEDLQALQAGKPLKHVQAGKGAKGRSSTNTTGPRAPIGARGTTGPRTPVQPRGTTGPASPVIVGDRTGSLSPTGPAGTASKAGKPNANNAVLMWVAAGTIAAILVVVLLVAGSGSNKPPKAESAATHATPEKHAAEAPAPSVPESDAGAPKVDVKAAGPTAREERARQALEAAQGYVKEHPDSFAEAQKLLTQAAAQARGTPSADGAAEALAALQKTWTAAMQEALKGPMEKAKAELSKNDFSAASAALSDEAVPANLRAFDWKPLLDGARAPVKESAEAAAAKFLADARAKAAEKTPEALAAAIELAGKADEIPAPLAPSAKEARREIKKWEGEIAALKKAAEKEQAARLAKAQEQVEAARKELAPLLEQNKFEQALGLLDKKMNDRAFADAKEGLAAEKADVETVLALRKRALEAVNAKPGARIKVTKGSAPIEGEVAANDRGGLTLKLGDGPEITFNAEQISAADIDRFAPPAKEGAGEDQRQRGLLFLAAGDLAAAKDRFEKAKAAGLPAADAYLGRLEALALGEAEASARKAWGKAEELFAAKQWKEAQEAYDEFARTHGKSKFAEQQAGAMKDRVAEIDAILNPYKPGLIAVFYKNEKVDDRNVGSTEIVKTLAWDVGKRSAYPNGPRDDFSARWFGFLKVEKEGRYDFDLDADEGARLYIDDKLVQDEWERNKNKQNPPVDLKEGMHELRVDYYERSGAAHCRLFWTLGKQIPRQIVPASALFHDPRKAPKDE
ncbi:MAG: protein kinase [Planctomycetota bacterium]|nr:protein kinase [Planctomycetota bacterium]